MPQKNNAVEVSVVADTISPNGHRITTVTFELWKPLLAELNTHRILVKNAASSRAIPSSVMRAKVWNNPYIPKRWPKNGSGMSPKEIYAPDSDEARRAEAQWLKVADTVAGVHSILTEKQYGLSIHKEIANRLIEPFLLMPVVVTATEWGNFFKLRCHEDAAYDFQVVACAIREAIGQSTPRASEWHAPFSDPAESLQELSDGLQMEIEDIQAIQSVARCARVSYRSNVTSKPSLIQEDAGLFLRLYHSGHMSPFEHAAISNKPSQFPFLGWQSIRHRPEVHLFNLVGDCEKIEEAAK